MVRVYLTDGTGLRFDFGSVGIAQDFYNWLTPDKNSQPRVGGFKSNLEYFSCEVTRIEWPKDTPSRNNSIRGFIIQK